MSSTRERDIAVGVNIKDHEPLWRRAFNELSGLSVRESMRLPLALAAVIGSTAISAALTEKADATSKKLAAPMEFVGFVENRLLNEDLAKAKTIAAQIKQNNGNSVLVALPWTYPGQTEVNNDFVRFCNAAKATQENNLNLFVTFYFYKSNENGSIELGFPPDRSSQITRFGTSIVAAISGIKNNPECAPNMNRIFIIPDNEPNYEVFRRNQYDAKGNFIAPEQAAKLQTRIYNLLKAEEQELNMQIVVLGGALSSTKDPVAFIKRMEGAQMDIFAYHPYNDVEDQRKIIQAVKETFGDSMRIMDTEYGYETRGNTQLQSTLEGKQASALKKAIGSAACQKIIGFLNFHLKDKDKREDLKTGIYKPNSEPKASQSVVSEMYASALAGTIEC